MLVHEAISPVTAIPTKSCDEPAGGCNAVSSDSWQSLRLTCQPSLATLWNSNLQAKVLALHMQDSPARQGDQLVHFTVWLCCKLFKAAKSENEHGKVRARKFCVEELPSRSQETVSAVVLMYHPAYHASSIFGES